MIHLCEMLETYLDIEQVAEVYGAYLFGAEAHDGQTRMTGEAYIHHPVNVARILAEMHMDAPSVIAAILHDVIEDTPTAKDQIASQFSEEVAELVDGVSKLTHIEFESKAEAQAENFRKMILAMVKDIRVILIKLADRLHNMRTLDVLRPDKRRRIARETLEIYAPIAVRLGMNSMRIELEDLGFTAMYPLRARVLADRLKKARGNRKEIVGKIEIGIRERMRQEGPEGRVVGREKHLYSLYKKMREKHLSMSEVMDVYAFRIIVDSVDACYRMLGLIHNLYTPVPGRFKDYIAIPKANGYQSLHTVVFTPYGVPIEVQIRTEDMDRVAEAGIAAHWLYKTKDENASNSAQVRAREWLRGLLEMQQHAGNSMEFLENVKIDLFPDEVFLFTPCGDILELPRGATVVDFAYAVHSDIGNHCVAAKIDKRLIPLRTKLHNGQTVEILTSPTAFPNPAWLNFVFTAKARANIRHYLKNLQREESIVLGRRLLDKSLDELDTNLEKIPPQRLEKILAEYHKETLDDLLESIGLGNRIPAIVARAMLDEDTLIEQGLTMADQGPLAIKGTEGTVVNYAKCCRPIPGDVITGFISTGRGIVVHTQHCKNAAEFRNQPDKWIDVDWDEAVTGDYPVELKLHVRSQRGVLAVVASTIADVEANIENVDMTERDGTHTTLYFTVLVKNRQHLAKIIRRLRGIDLVERITRSHR